MEWKFEEQFMMDQWDKWMRWILERRGSLPRDCFENFLEEVIDLKAKHDELAELVECYLACDSAYSGMWRDSRLKKRSHEVLYHSYHNDSTITGLGYTILMETRFRLLAALRKAAEGGK
jgi:hypothetical protein